MRKDLYKALAQRLKEQVPEIRHIDLWNQNVDFIEEEAPWDRPAVFVEFQPIEWRPTAGGLWWDGRGRVALHVVTDWKGSSAAGSETQDEALEMLDWSERIHAALAGLRGEAWSDLRLVETHTNHNHEDIVESVEVYAVRCERHIEAGAEG